MSTVYAQRGDVFGVGVPRGALTRPARQVASVDAIADVIEIAGHGLAPNDSVEFTTSGIGVLPSGLAPLTIYYAKLITLADGSTDENRFQVSLALNGSAVNFTNAGTQPYSLVVPTGPMIDKYCEIYSRWVDSVCVADAVPLVAPFPVWVTHIVALRAAIATANALGKATPTLSQRETTEIVDFLRMAKGLPLRGDASAQSSTNTALARSAAACGRVDRGRLP